MANSPEVDLKAGKAKNRLRDKDPGISKRRCVSTACIACRRRKSKCDGKLPSCAACALLYGTECVYDPNSDHRRKGVYKKDIDSLKTRNTTLQTLVQGILNYPEDEVMSLVTDIRSCENLDDVAEAILARELTSKEEDADDAKSIEGSETSRHTFEKELSGKMGGLRFEDGIVRFIGGTSNLLFDDLGSSDPVKPVTYPGVQQYTRQEDAVRSWTSVTVDVDLILHLLNMYFTWHYTFFTTLSKFMFFQEFFQGKPIYGRRKTGYCTSLLVNAMLALGCHFTSWPAARDDPHESATAGDHFFKEAKRLIIDNDEYEYPRLATVQALALMSVREAGCGREAKGWVYSGMSFRMACDLGLNVKNESTSLDEYEVDAQRVTFWGCFLFDKCWSNYLGRPPQLPLTNITVPKFDVFPSEDSEMWSPWIDSGIDQSHRQPSRTRAVALMISSLCEISNNILLAFYRPEQLGKPLGKRADIKRLGELHTGLEAWRCNISKDLGRSEGQLPHVLLMHMFFHLQFIHLFRPFLKVTQPNGPFHPHAQPRAICTKAAAAISKLIRMYKRTYGLRQICNIAVYIVHSACTIHLLNLPDKDARRDIIHGVRHLEEIAESWLCARRTLTILCTQAQKWNVELPSDAVEVLQRAEEKYRNIPSPRSSDDGRLSCHFSPATMQPMSLHPIPIPAGTSNTKEPAMASNNVDEPVASSLHHLPRMLINRTTECNHLDAACGSMSQAAITSPTSDEALPATFLGSAWQPAEDSKDWWMRDQSAYFDNWDGASSTGMDVQEVQASVSLPGGVCSNGAEAGLAGVLNGIDGSKEEADFTADGYSLGCLGYDQIGIYGGSNKGRL